MDEQEQVIEQEPVAASYLVRVTLRGKGEDAPTNAKMQAAIEGAIGELVDYEYGVTASSTRMDR